MDVPKEVPDRDERLIAEALTEVRQEEALLKHAEENLEKIEHKLEEAEHEKRHHIDLVINTRAKPWLEETITYEQVVTLAALPLPQGPNPGFLVVFEDGPQKNPSGTLVAGQSVRVKNEMVFHVTPTNRS